jgi:hypothetical protein
MQYVDNVTNNLYKIVIVYIYFGNVAKIALFAAGYDGRKKTV